jgi:mevalonate kinase
MNLKCLIFVCGLQASSCIYSKATVDRTVADAVRENTQAVQAVRAEMQGIKAELRETKQIQQEMLRALHVNTELLRALLNK